MSYRGIDVVRNSHLFDVSVGGKDFNVCLMSACAPGKTPDLCMAYCTIGKSSFSAYSRRSGAQAIANMRRKIARRMQ